MFLAVYDALCKRSVAAIWIVEETQPELYTKYVGYARVDGFHSDFALGDSPSQRLDIDFRSIEAGSDVQSGVYRPRDGVFVCRFDGMLCLYVFDSPAV